MTAPTIRPERPEDADAVHRVLTAAFPGDAEARLVRLLRDHGRATIALVAEHRDQVVGHVLFSPVSLAGEGGIVHGLGLAPVAVLPGLQRRGIGSALIRAGLDRCRERGAAFVVVLGEPDYYARFGFTRASLRGLRNEYGVDEPFMALVLNDSALPQVGGLVRYAPEFATVA